MSLQWHLAVQRRQWHRYHPGLSVDDRSLRRFGREAGNKCAFENLRSVQHGSRAQSSGAWEWQALCGHRTLVRDGSVGMAQFRDWLVVKQAGTMAPATCTSLGTYPKANEAARKRRTETPAGFKCENDVPAYDSKIGPRSPSKFECLQALAGPTAKSRRLSPRQLLPWPGSCACARWRRGRFCAGGWISGVISTSSSSPT